MINLIIWMALFPICVEIALFLNAKKNALNSRKLSEEQERIYSIVYFLIWIIVAYIINSKIKG